MEMEMIILNKKLIDAINVQINYEIESAHIYLAMGSYVSTLGLEGFENWMIIQYQEELAHARKFINYLQERGARVEIKGFADPENNFDSMLDVLEDVKTILSILVSDCRNCLPTFLSGVLINVFRCMGSKSIINFNSDNNEYLIEL